MHILSNPTEASFPIVVLLISTEKLTSSTFFSLSIKRLRRALHLTIQRHETLRSSVSRDPATNEWVQQIQQLEDEGFTFIKDRLADYQDDIENAVQQEYKFGIHDVPHGRLVRLHLVQQDSEKERDDDELLPGDYVIINVRHEGIDGTSVPIFINTFAQAYTSGKQEIVPSNAIRYLDYMIYLQELDLSASRAYWNEQMASFDFARHFRGIPIDRP